MDIGFFEPSPDDSGDDLELISATSLSGRVIYPVYIAALPSLGRIAAFQKPFPALSRAAAGLGHAHIEPSLDGVVRKMYLLQRCGGEEIPAFSVRIIQEYLFRGGLNSELRKGKNRLRIGDISIPSLKRPDLPLPAGGLIRQDYLTYISYSGPEGSFLTLSAWKVLEPNFPLRIFRNKIVLIGGTAAGLFDQGITPFSTTRKPMPAIEIQANLINGILSRNLITRISAIRVILAIFIVSLGAGFIFYYLKTAGGLLTGVAMVGGITGSYLFLLYRWGRWCDIWPLMAVLFLTYLTLNARKLGLLFASLDGEIKTLTRIKKISLPAAASFPEKDLLQRLYIFLSSLLNIQAIYLLRIDPRGKKLLPQAAPSPAKPASSYPFPAAWRGLTEPRLTTGPPLPRGLLCPWRRGADLSGFFLFTRSPRKPFLPKEIKFCREVARQLSNILPIDHRPVRSKESSWRFFQRREMTDKIKSLNLLSRSISYEQALLSSILTSITEAVVVSDLLGNIVLVNQRGRDILHLSPGKLTELNIFSLLQELTPLSDREIRNQFFQREEESPIFPLEIKRGSNYYLLSLTPIGGEGPIAPGLMAVLSDITHLKQLDQLRTDTFSILTHEIKNPLSGILGYCELLTEKKYPSAEINKDLNLIHLSARKIHQLVGDYLEVARLESGREEMTNIPLDLGGMIQQEITLLLPAARQKGIQLKSELQDSLPEFQGDLNLLDRAFTNLINNAIKYTPAGKAIRVKLFHRDHSFIFQVADEGFGIAPEEKEKIFEKFYRGENARLGKIPGTGLGLTITQEIIRRHRGEISVESHPGEGSTFTIILPEKRVAREDNIA